MRVELVNEVMSQGRVIITDRLHASIASVLMGKPHVMLNEKYKKVMNTREVAFKDKPECADTYVQGYYVDTIEQSIDKAIDLLKSLNY
jgi:exopolysaccharide biosynthesis predicted pyruvyltransferase EpsI